MTINLNEGNQYDVDPQSNLFLKGILNVVSNPQNLLFFNGKKVKQEFGKGLCINGGIKPKLKTWSDVTKFVIDKGGNIGMRNHSSNRAIHVHNEFMPGDFIELLQREAKKHDQWRPKTLFDGDGASNVLMQVPLPKPLVLTNTVDENWGFLSTPIGTRTAKWLNLTNHLRIHNANYDTLRAIIDSDKIVMLMTNSHVDPKLGAHKKVISLPLGIRARQNVFKAMKRYQNFNKTKLFTINNSGWKERTRINEMLIAKFKKYNYTLINSFPGKFRKEEALKAGVMLYKDHYQEVAESLFTLCPSGLSMDSYRLWETLALGSIPVVESNAGFDRTYSNLPVLVVRNYSSITPSFLVEAYSCFQEHAEDYKYVHMTQQYWHHLLHRSLKHASVDHITRNHPYRNAYCDFLDYEENREYDIENGIGLHIKGSNSSKWNNTHVSNITNSSYRTRVSRVKMKTRPDGRSPLSFVKT